MLSSIMVEVSDTYTLTEFAGKAGVSKNAISKWIKKEKPKGIVEKGTVMLIPKSLIEEYRAYRTK